MVPYCIQYCVSKCNISDLTLKDHSFPFVLTVAMAPAAPYIAPHRTSHQWCLLSQIRDWQQMRVHTAHTSCNHGPASSDHRRHRRWWMYTCQRNMWQDYQGRKMSVYEKKVQYINWENMQGGVYSIQSLALSCGIHIKSKATSNKLHSLSSMMILGIWYSIGNT